MHTETKPGPSAPSEVTLSFAEVANQSNHSMPIMDYFAMCNKTKFVIENFFDLVQLIYTGNDYNILLAVVGFWKMMSLLKNPPV